MKYPVLRHFDGDWVLVPTRDVLHFREHARAVRWVQQHLVDSHGSAHRLHETLTTLRLSRPDSTEKAVDELARKLTNGELIVIRLEAQRYELVAPPPIPRLADLVGQLGENDGPAPARPKPRPQSQVAWLEVRVARSDGRPLSHATIEVRLPSGSSFQVMLDELGRWRDDKLEPTATCQVRLVGSLPRPGKRVLDGFEITDAMPRIEAGGAAVSLDMKRSHTLIVPVGTSCVRLTGMSFALNKAFLLPAALEGIRLMRLMYGKHPSANLLIVGHTDRAGSARRNLSLSLERAEAVRAYLQDDVEHWLAHYGKETDFSRRWGESEDLAMLSALPNGQTPYYDERHDDHSFEAAVRRFQEEADLEPTGKPDVATRRELIVQYMAVDGTSLPEGTPVACCGAGEAFPVIETEDGTKAEENRRVELFLFRDPIDPPPPGDNLSPDAPHYQQWLDTVDEERTFTPSKAGLGSLLVVTDLEYERTQEYGISFILRSTDGAYEAEVRPEDHAVEVKGFVEVQFSEMPKGSFYSLFVRYSSGAEAAVFTDVPYPELRYVSDRVADELLDPFTNQPVPK